MEIPENIHQEAQESLNFKKDPNRIAEASPKIKGRAVLDDGRK